MASFLSCIGETSGRLLGSECAEECGIVHQKLSPEVNAIREG